MTSMLDGNAPYSASSLRSSNSASSPSTSKTKIEDTAPVPLRIDRQMLALVDRFGVEVMGHTDKKRRGDQRTVENDLSVANYLGDASFWLDYNCDKRGRVYSTSHF